MVIIYQRGKDIRINGLSLCTPSVSHGTHSIRVFGLLIGTLRQQTQVVQFGSHPSEEEIGLRKTSLAIFGSPASDRDGVGRDVLRDEVLVVFACNHRAGLLCRNDGRAYSGPHVFGPRRPRGPHEVRSSSGSLTRRYLLLFLTP